jgi:hypothetical protein
MNINIKNEKQLLSFLKLISEEAAKKSKGMLDDPVSTKYSKQYIADVDKYGSLSEGEGEPLDPAAEEPAGEEPAGEEPAAEEPAEEEPAEVEGETEEEPDPPTYEKFINTINDARSGFSVDNDEVENNLKSFYEKLDEDEKLMLYLLFKNTAGILTGTLDAEKAKLPSKPPYSLDIQNANEKADSEAEEGAAEDTGEDENRMDMEEPAAEEPAAEGEDTEPPIAVNEQQNKEWLRRKIRILMS